MHQNGSDTRSLRAVEDDEHRRRLSSVSPERREEDEAAALIRRIRPRPLPWTPPSAA